RATSRIHRSSRGAANTHTAAGLPAKGRSVNASTWMIVCDMVTSALRQKGSWTFAKRSSTQRAGAAVAGGVQQPRPQERGRNTPGVARGGTGVDSAKAPERGGSVQIGGPHALVYSSGLARVHRSRCSDRLHVPRSGL